MSKRRNYVFVLWGDGFDEVAATIFVTQLREAGLRVKIVSLTLQHISGAHGLTLLPDLTLDEALPLADQAICIIVPYTSPGIIRLRNDPRVRKFFRRADAHQARFVTGSLYNYKMTDLGLASQITHAICYPGEDALLDFVRELANSLLRACGKG